eukprot:scaffold1019_cov123-Cylindrotheca_fusiformis.AAC.9
MVFYQDTKSYKVSDVLEKYRESSSRNSQSKCLNSLPIREKSRSSDHDHSSRTRSSSYVSMEHREETESDEARDDSAEEVGRGDESPEASVVGKLRNKGVWPPIQSSSSPEVFLGTGPTGTPRRNPKRTASFQLEQNGSNDQNLQTQVHRESCSKPASLQRSANARISKKYLSTVAPQKTKDLESPETSDSDMPEDNHQDTAATRADPADTNASWMARGKFRSSLTEKKNTSSEESTSSTLDADTNNAVEQRAINRASCSKPSLQRSANARISNKYLSAVAPQRMQELESPETSHNDMPEDKHKDRGSTGENLTDPNASWMARGKFRSSFLGEKNTASEDASPSTLDADTNKAVEQRAINRASCSNPSLQRTATARVSSKYLSAIAPQKTQEHESPDTSDADIPEDKYQSKGGKEENPTAPESSSMPKGKVQSSFLKKKNTSTEESTSSRLEADTNKAVEQRVNIIASKMEKRFQAEINRIECRMDREYKDRIEELEYKVNQMNSDLSKLLSKEGRQSGRREI